MRTAFLFGFVFSITAYMMGFALGCITKKEICEEAQRLPMAAKIAFLGEIDGCKFVHGTPGAFK